MSSAEFDTKVLVPAFALMALFLGIAACGPTTSERAVLCTPGESASCTCEDGRTGAQTCKENGTGYGECVCKAPYQTCEGEECKKIYDTAVQKAVKDLRDRGYNFDRSLWEDGERFGVLLSRTYHHLGVPETEADGNSRRQALESGWCGPKSGWWNERLAQAVSAGDRPGPCLNEVCKKHDRCYGRENVDPTCMWSKSSKSCDNDFFAGYHACKVKGQCGPACKIIAAVARTLQADRNSLNPFCEIAGSGVPSVSVAPTEAIQDKTTVHQIGEGFTPGTYARCTSVHKTGPIHFKVKVDFNGGFDHLYSPTTNSKTGKYTFSCTDAKTGKQSNKVKFRVKASAKSGVSCGDGKCEGSETHSICSQDCPPPNQGPTCGDNKCESGESRQNCPQDCGQPKTGPNCGNNRCEGGEDPTTCQRDCPCPGTGQPDDWTVVDPKGNKHLWAVEGSYAHMIVSYSTVRHLGAENDIRPISDAVFRHCYTEARSLDGGDNPLLQVPGDKAVYMFENGQVVKPFFNRNAFDTCSGTTETGRVFAHATKTLLNNLGRGIQGMFCDPNQPPKSCGDGGTKTCTQQCEWSNCTGQSCSGPSTRTCGKCGTQRRSCNNGSWSAWSTCRNEGVCSPGQTASCGNGGTKTCSQSCSWGTCTGKSCSGPSTRTCGKCGTQTRSCNNGSWSAWSTCRNEGTCSPGQTASCGNGGTKTCSQSCSWGTCTGQSCSGPSNRTCGKCGTQRRSCNNGSWSAWSTCRNEGVCSPGQTASCGSGGTKTCSQSCSWSTCTGRSCSGPSRRDCGNCGVQTRSCNNGSWSTWSTCRNEGVCSPGQTASCGNGGTKTCSQSCQWSTCSTLTPTETCNGQDDDNDCRVDEGCGNILTNGSFKSGLTGWDSYVDGGNGYAMTSSIAKGADCAGGDALKLGVTRINNNDSRCNGPCAYSAELRQVGLPATDGKKVRVSFRAKASGLSEFSVGFRQLCGGDCGGPACRQTTCPGTGNGLSGARRCCWQPYGGGEQTVYGPNSAWTTYSFVFGPIDIAGASPGTTRHDGRLLFNVGASTGTLFLDDVRVEVL